MVCLNPTNILLNVYVCIDMLNFTIFKYYLSKIPGEIYHFLIYLDVILSFHLLIIFLKKHFRLIRRGISYIIKH